MLGATYFGQSYLAGSLVQGAPVPPSEPGKGGGVGQPVQKHGEVSPKTKGV